MKDEIIVGKYTLESLTNGMYADPLDLFREYIQNAVDSIDTAVEIGIGNKKDFHIEIVVDDLSGQIRIHDNACGVSRRKIKRSLIDIGNSQKDKKKNRGFRGIGRLAGLGYCDELRFETSYLGEPVKTILVFDTAKLGKLMMADSEEYTSIADVISSIVSICKEPEKENKHYFDVLLEGVQDKDRLLNIDEIRDYLIQHAPLPFSKDFVWSDVIKKKMRTVGYVIPEYSIFLNGDKLFKPYHNSVLTDRVRKINDSICDVEIKPFFEDGKLTAILWYGDMGFFGTILDSQVKGIRIRQGNILIGDKSTSNALFKEERFNGWLLGELYVVGSDIIANARRDNFELNEAYYDLSEAFIEWSLDKTKDLRKKSYDRSLEEKSKRIVESEKYEDVECSTADLINIISERDLIDKSESDEVAQTDYIDKLSWILNHKKRQTRYLALNLNEKLSIDQRKTLERVFDIIMHEYRKPEAEKIINTISNNF